MKRFSFVFLLLMLHTAASAQPYFSGYANFRFETVMTDSATGKVMRMTGAASWKISGPYLLNSGRLGKMEMGSWYDGIKGVRTVWVNKPKQKVCRLRAEQDQRHELAYLDAVATADTMTIHGYLCRRYEVPESDKYEITLWVAESLPLHPGLMNFQSLRTQTMPGVKGLILRMEVKSRKQQLRGLYECTYLTEEPFTPEDVECPSTRGYIVVDSIVKLVQ